MKDVFDVLKVPKDEGEKKLQEVKTRGILDPNRKIEHDSGFLFIPVIKGGNTGSYELEKREGQKTPFDKVVDDVEIDDKLIPLLPSRWEAIGDVLLIKLDEPLIQYKGEVGRAYAETLDMKTVLLQGRISGKKREPKTEIIYGRDTETVHTENAIKYKMDVAKVMFSSGNVDERIRMGGLDVQGEIVVDMFSGIGYFSLPLAVYGRALDIHSLEINPTAYHYLQENVHINNVEDVVHPWLGDNRDFSLEQNADRVVMGYLHDTHKYLPKALEFLGGRGMIHYHSLCKDIEYPQKLDDEIKGSIDLDCSVSQHKIIKSYAPHIYHTVTDIRVG
ncbi:MAG: class I SAM-dependent methyltransferase family protein [Thermoplasmata archaeon]